MNPNKALWEKGDFTRLAATMRDDGIRRALVFVTSAYTSFSGCRQYQDDQPKQQREGRRIPEVRLALPGPVEGESDGGDRESQGDDEDRERDQGGEVQTGGHEPNRQGPPPAVPGIGPRQSVVAHEGQVRRSGHGVQPCS